MANAFSVPQSMGEYIQPVNLGLVNATLGSKQQKYDYNVAKIDSLLSEFSSIELLRDQDKQYLADRVNGVLTTVNEMQKDLSKNGQTRDIMQYIGTAIDDNVLHHAGIAIKVKNFEQGVAERREKKPDTYSDINYTYARKVSGLDNYLEGVDKNGNKVEDVGNLQYSEYKDVNKRVNDVMLDLLSKNKDSVVEIPEYDSNGAPTGYMIKKTVRGLTQDQIRNVAESQLDASHMQQIKINGWYNAGGYEDPTLINQNLDIMVKTSLDSIDSQILKLKRDKDNGVASSDVDTQIQSLENNKVNVKKNIDSYKKNPELAATFIEKERVLSGAVNTFQNFYSEDISYSANDAYYKQQNLALEQAKFKYEVEKEVGKTGTTGEAYTTTVPTQTPEEIESYQTSIDNQITEASTTTKTVRDSYINALENEAAKGNKDAANFLSEYDKLKSTKKGGQSDDIVFDNLIASTTYKDKLNILGDSNFRYNLKEAQDRERLLLTGLSEAKAKGMAAHIDSTINSKEGFEAFFKNGETKMLWKGKAIPVKDVLMATGLMDRDGKKLGDLKTNKEVLKELQKSFYADDVISKGFDQAKGSLKNLAESLGENYNSVVSTIDLEVGNRGRVEKQYLIKPGSKTANYIEQAKKNGIYDTFGFSDQSLSSDDATIGKFLRGGYSDTAVYKNEIKRYYNNLPSTQQLSIPASDKANFERLRGYMAITNASVTKDAPITISKSGTNVVLTQAHTEGSGEKKDTSPIVTTLTQEEFNSNFGGLSSKMNFNNEAAFYTTDKMQGKKLVSEPIKYFSKADYKTISYVNSAVLNNEAAKTIFGGYLTEADSYNNLYKNHQMLSKRFGAGQFDNLVKSALSKDVANKFSVNMLVDRDYSGEPILQVNLVSNSGENIHSEVIRGNENITNFKGILDTAPQAYYGMMLDSIFAEEQDLMSSGSSATSESLTKLSKYLP